MVGWLVGWVVGWLGGWLVGWVGGGRGERERGGGAGGRSEGRSRVVWPSPGVFLVDTRPPKMQCLAFSGFTLWNAGASRGLWRTEQLPA